MDVNEFRDVIDNRLAIIARPRIPSGPGALCHISGSVSPEKKTSAGMMIRFNFRINHFTCIGIKEIPEV